MSVEQGGEELLQLPCRMDSFLYSLRQAHSIQDNESFERAAEQNGYRQEKRPGQTLTLQSYTGKDPWAGKYSSAFSLAGVCDIRVNSLLAVSQ